MRERVAEVQLAARAEQARLSEEYVRRTREQLHESRSRLTLIRYYLDVGALGELSDYLDEIRPEAGRHGAAGLYRPQPHRRRPCGSARPGGADGYFR